MVAFQTTQKKNKQKKKQMYTHMFTICLEIETQNFHKDTEE